MIEKKKTYCFDLDDTLCITNGMDYEDSKPIKERINKVNNLYNEGNTILIDSARGTKTGICWTKKTKKQLKTWGLKYHLLRCGSKFAADLYIDDKGVNTREWFKTKIEEVQL